MWRNSILEVIGNTPLIRLNRIGRGLRPTLLAKLEYLNPGGSVKDRIGVAMLEAAEKAGRIKLGGTIIEGTSGNTGMGLALAAAIKGYRCIFTMPDKMSQEKIDSLRALGAEVIVTPTEVDHDDPRSYHSVALRLSREIPNSLYPNQYENPANAEAHYKTTGPEIWEQTEGRLTAVVIGVGTGGTITGVGRMLKERAPEALVVAVEPASSPVLSGGAPGPHKIQGIGAGFVPEVLDRAVVDEVLSVGDEDALEMARLLAKEEGILAGISAGANVWAALEVAARPELAGKRVVTVVCDSGERYMSLPFFSP